MKKFHKILLFCFILVVLLVVVFTIIDRKQKGDLILKNAEIYTMDETNKWASALVINDNKIIAVLENGENIKKYLNENSKIIDLKGKFVLPGFIDGHVHFNRAGALINDANLLTVSDDKGLKKEISRVVNILEEGEWITGGLWGAYEKWSLGASKVENEKKERWKPDKDIIDDITKSNPCFLSSYDGKFFLANTAALKAAGINEKPLAGMETNQEGKTTGLIYKGSTAIEKIKSVIKEKKSHKRLLKENRAALKRLAECGIVEVHDIAKPGQTKRFVELQENGQLTCRVWLRPDLSRVEEITEKGFKMGLNPKTKKQDRWLRYGAFKGYIDGIMGTHGALFFKPYTDQPNNYGHYRKHTSDDPDLKEGNMDKMYKLIGKGYEAGFVSNVHAIGTKGVALMLDTYEKLSKEYKRKLEGFRIIHAQVVREQDFARFKKLNIIAEVNPYHLSDDMRWMEERIGHERCKGAYAFKSLLENNVTLSFGSDWPGTSVAEYRVHPKYLIHAAINRTTIKSKPEGGWFPEQKISVHEALKAYTINNAYAAFEDHLRGSIEKGKLADIVVCDKNLLKINPKDILKINIVMTIVDGKIVFSEEKGYCGKISY